jgi:hypothetical protein
MLCPCLSRIGTCKVAQLELALRRTLRATVIHNKSQLLDSIANGVSLAGDLLETEILLEVGDPHPHKRYLHCYR